MEKDKIESIEDLKALAKNKFHVLMPSDERSGKFNLTLEINSYLDLQFLILDIVKVSLAALDADKEGVTDVKNPHSAVRGVLQFVLQMVPLEEMQLVDKIYEIVLKDNEQNNS